MKLELTALLALCLCLAGCGKDEKPETQAKGKKPLTSTVPDAKEAQPKPKSPEPKIEAKDNSKAKTSQPKQDVALTEEEAFKIFADALSGIAFDERNKSLFKIEADNHDFDFPSISFTSRVPPGIPSDKMNAGQDLRRIMFRVEDASSEADRVKIAEINKRIDKIKDAEKKVRQEISELRLARRQKTQSPPPVVFNEPPKRYSPSPFYNVFPSKPVSRKPPKKKRRGGGGLGAIPSRGKQSTTNPPKRSLAGSDKGKGPREQTKQDALISDMNMRLRELSKEISNLRKQIGKAGKRQLVMYQEPLQKVEGVAKEEPKAKRWVLGPNIDVISVGFWMNVERQKALGIHEEKGVYVPDWDDEPGFPERIKVEMAFEQADGSPAELHDIHHCVVFSPKAAKANLKAAEQGEAQAQYHLGTMYSNGNQVKQDDKKALKWWRKAAEQGYARAQSQLALAYFKGEGVPKDIVIACAWLYLAKLDYEESNQIDGDLNIFKGEELRSKITPEQFEKVVSKAESMAKGWLRKNPKLWKLK